MSDQEMFSVWRHLCPTYTWNPLVSWQEELKYNVETIPSSDALWFYALLFWGASHHGCKEWFVWVHVRSLAVLLLSELWFVSMFLTLLCVKYRFLIHSYQPIWHQQPLNSQSFEKYFELWREHHFKPLICIWMIFCHVTGRLLHRIRWPGVQVFLLKWMVIWWAITRINNLLRLDK